MAELVRERRRAVHALQGRGLLRSARPGGRAAGDGCCWRSLRVSVPASDDCGGPRADDTLEERVLRIELPCGPLQTAFLRVTGRWPRVNSGYGAALLFSSEWVDEFHPPYFFWGIYHSLLRGPGPVAQVPVGAQCNADLVDVDNAILAPVRDGGTARMYLYTYGCPEIHAQVVSCTLPEQVTPHISSTGAADALAGWSWTSRRTAERIYGVQQLPLPDCTPGPVHLQPPTLSYGGWDIRAQCQTVPIARFSGLAGRLLRLTVAYEVGPHPCSAPLLGLFPLPVELVDDLGWLVPAGEALRQLPHGVPFDLPPCEVRQRIYTVDVPISSSSALLRAMRRPVSGWNEYRMRIESAEVL